jgi:hypothetical protein
MRPPSESSFERSTGGTRARFVRRSRDSLTGLASVPIEVVTGSGVGRRERADRLGSPYDVDSGLQDFRHVRPGRERLLPPGAIVKGRMAIQRR